MDGPRQLPPLADEGTEVIQLDDGRHASCDAFLADVGRRLELPGYGDKALLSATGELRRTTMRATTT